MKILAIDYDGVIVDSVLESLFISHNAYLKLYGKNKREMFGGKLLTFQKWPAIQKKYKKDIQYYSSLRPYIRGATDYGLIQKIMEEGKSIYNQREFDEYRKTVQFDFQKFHDLFYLERKKVQQENYTGWLSLEPPFQEVLKGIRQFISEGLKVVIATSNRREYIADTFLPQYFNIKIDQDDILDFSFGEDKSIQMQYLQEKYQLNYENICFIDDQLAHLELVHDLGINVVLAGWSYDTSQQKKDALQKGFPLAEKEEDFYPKIKKCFADK
ncbi:MAG: hypothetical protein PHD33_07340 [Atribacterota bacterium]|nr:hypothetical protein [Atribacterota bacterium]